MKVQQKKCEHQIQLGSLQARNLPLQIEYKFRHAANLPFTQYIGVTCHPDGQLTALNKKSSCKFTRVGMAHGRVFLFHLFERARPSQRAVRMELVRAPDTFAEPKCRKLHRYRKCSSAFSHETTAFVCDAHAGPRLYRGAHM